MTHAVSLENRQIQISEPTAYGGRFLQVPLWGSVRKTNKKSLEKKKKIKKKNKKS